MSCGGQGIGAPESGRRRVRLGAWLGNAQPRGKQRIQKGNSPRSVRGSQHAADHRDKAPSPLDGHADRKEVEETLDNFDGSRVWREGDAEFPVAGKRPALRAPKLWPLARRTPDPSCGETMARIGDGSRRSRGAYRGSSRWRRPRRRLRRNGLRTSAFRRCRLPCDCPGVRSVPRRPRVIR